MLLFSEGKKDQAELVVSTENKTARFTIFNLKKKQIFSLVFVPKPINTRFFLTFFEHLMTGNKGRYPKEFYL